MQSIDAGAPRNPQQRNTIPLPLITDASPNERDIIITITDTTLYAETLAAEFADQRLASRRRYSLFRPYFQAYFHDSEKRRILARMQSTQDIYAVENPVLKDTTTLIENKRAKQRFNEDARAALFNRVFRGDLHRRAGEYQIQLTGELNQVIANFIQDHINGVHPDETEAQARIRLRSIIQQHLYGEQALRRHDIILTNITDRLDSLVKANINNKDFKPDVNIYIARVATGIRTVYEGNVVDAFLRNHIYATRWGAIINPVVVAGVVYLGSSAISKAAYGLGGFALAAVTAGIVSASRERFTLQQQQVSQHRAMAINEDILDRTKDRRRVELEGTIHKLESAEEMIQYLWEKYKLLPFTNNGNDGRLDSNFLLELDNACLTMLAKYRALVDLSDDSSINPDEKARGYDLISYTSDVFVEWQRASIDQMLKGIERFIKSDWQKFVRDPQQIAEMQTKWNLYDRIRRETMVTLHDEIIERDRLFHQMERTYMARAFAITFASGLIGGAIIHTIASELGAFNEYSNTPYHPSPSTSKYFDTYFSPDGRHAFSSQVPILFQKSGPNSYNMIINQSSKSITINNAFTDGNFNQSALNTLHRLGFDTSQSTITTPVNETVTQNITTTPPQFLANAGIKPTDITSRNWVTNNSSIPTGNALGLSEKSTASGITWTMNATHNGSFQSGVTYDLPNLIKEGKISDILTYVDQKGGYHSYSVPLNSNGQAVLPTNSPLWQVFSDNGQNRAGFSEIAEVVNGHETIFATAPMPSNVIPIPPQSTFHILTNQAHIERIPLLKIAQQQYPSAAQANPVSTLQGVITDPFFMPIIPFPRRQAGRMIHTRRKYHQSAA